VWLPEKKGFRVMLDAFPEPPPVDSLAVLFGEYIHNLRSALDNLAYALARTHTDPPAKPKAIGFPIFHDAVEFKRNAKRYIDQLPPEAIELITRIQPYNRDTPEQPKLSASDPLVLLQNFNNMDKHQVPSIVLVIPKGYNAKLSIEFESEEATAAEGPMTGLLWGGALSEGVVLYETITRHSIAKVGVNLGFTARFEIYDGENHYDLAAHVININNYVNHVVGLFQQFFPEPGLPAK
jgi:hypothetical protein